ncbi:MAG: cyclic nucleotide-binding domain-containing protein [Lachnospiraceae bacterium]|nr:cyclic nucleotide-binding domain-containing protein [Lachnospiraceae bacterium]
MNIAVYNENCIIFEEGTFEKAMYDVIKGKVGIYSGYRSDNEKLIAEIGPGELFGEMGVLEIYPRSATAVVLEKDTQIAEIRDNDLQEYLSDKPDKLLVILKLLSRRTRETNEKYLDVCRVMYETDQAEKKGEERSSKLNAELERIDREFGEINTLWLN